MVSRGGKKKQKQKQWRRPQGSPLFLRGIITIPTVLNNITIILVIITILSISITIINRLIIIMASDPTNLHVLVLLEAICTMNSLYSRAVEDGGNPDSKLHVSKLHLPTFELHLSRCRCAFQDTGASASGQPTSICRDETILVGKHPAGHQFALEK